MFISKICFVLLTIFMAYMAYENENDKAKIVALYLVYIVTQIIFPNGALSSYKDSLSAILTELLKK